MVAYQDATMLHRNKGKSSMDYQTGKRFGARLRTIRERKRLTQEQLSAMMQVNGADLTRSALAKIEAGQRHVYLAELIALQKILCVPFEELLTL